MAKLNIQLEVRDCQDCPCVKAVYSWGDTFSYFCTLKKNKYCEDGMPIASQVEYRSEMPEVPKWCPALVK